MSSAASTAVRGPKERLQLGEGIAGGAGAEDGGGGDVADKNKGPRSGASTPRDGAGATTPRVLVPAKGQALNDPAALSAAATWALNVFSSVSLILTNKAVMQTCAFRFATTLTALHFCLTASAGLLAQASGQLSDTRLPFLTLFWFSLAADVSVVTMNLSLMLNSVGFYQIAKLSIIPTCCAFEWLLFSKTFSWEVLFSVVVVVLGVGICTITDVSVSLFGLIAALCAVVSTSLQQIYVGQLQKQYGIGSFDLLSQTAPIQAVCLVIAGPFVDFLLTQRSVFNYSLSPVRVLAILGSCVLALFVNISVYLCIGKFSAVSFQVLGHMKTVLVLVMGWTLFDSAVTLKNLGGMIMAVVGMVLYSWAVEVDKAKAAASRGAGAPAASAKDGGGDKSVELEERSTLLQEEKVKDGIVRNNSKDDL